MNQRQRAHLGSSSRLNTLKKHNDSDKTGVLDSFDNNIESVRGIKEVTFDRTEKPAALKSSAIFINDTAKDFKIQHETVEVNRRNFDTLGQQKTGTFFGLKQKDVAQEASSIHEHSSLEGRASIDVITPGLIVNGKTLAPNIDLSGDAANFTEYQSEFLRNQNKSPIVAAPQHYFPDLSNARTSLAETKISPLPRYGAMASRETTGSISQMSRLGPTSGAEAVTVQQALDGRSNSNISHHNVGIDAKSNEGTSMSRGSKSTLARQKTNPPTDVA